MIVIDNFIVVYLTTPEAFKQEIGLRWFWRETDQEKVSMKAE